MTTHRRPHQKLAIFDILSEFKRHARGQFISACGTGKTATALWVKEDLDAHHTLVLIPSIALVDQFASEWRKFASPGQQYATLCVCSDKTVGRNGDDYDAVEFTAEDLAHDGFEVTSDAGRIADFMCQPGHRVIFSTYQSSHLIEEAQRDNAVPAFDLAIADEAHRCAGKRDSDFAIILDDGRIRASKRLFATATPKIQRTKKKNNEIENVADMNDEAAFGKVFHRLTLGSAIKRRILSDYRVFITQVDDPGLHRELNAKDESTKVLKRRSVQVSMLKTIREYGLQRVVTFHNRVEDAKLYAAELPQVAAAVAGGGRPAVTPGAVDYVSGKMSAEVRKQKLDVFRGNGDGACHVLSNARCLSEGVDVPSIDGVVFVDPRSSEIEIVQALGRAIRQHGDKEYGTIVVPVFVAKGQSAADAIEHGSFKHVVDLLNALRAHDMEFGAALDGMRQRQANGKPIEGDADPFTKIKFDLKGIQDMDRTLRPMLLESLTDSFQEGLGYIKAYVAEHGHCRVPDGYKTPDGFRLACWVMNRRTDRKVGRLSPERIAALDELGFVWDVLEANWEEGVACLASYHAEHGHCNVPRPATWPEGDPDGFQLGRWLSRQRQIYKQDKLSAKRKQKLESIGMVWDVHEAMREASWEEGVACLASYHAEHGHCNVLPSATWPEGKPDGFRLGNWVSGKRQSLKAGTLSPEQIAALDELWFAWNVFEADFQEGLGYLKVYKEEYGHCRAPRACKTPDGYKLGIWVSSRRIDRKAGKLSPERIAALDELRFVWELGKKQEENAPTIPLPDLADRLKNEESADDLPDLMAQHGCDPEESRALIEAGNFDDALRLLEDATGESLRLRRE